ncbi:MFS transporter [Actinomycetospora corticicola]|uniref:MFS family permease n=1 Tax=Actinomycetospora corticicola TaxID=663602 RepID=A0A7Y9DXB9_9PSEU|nr:MFS transporter [Actinomycetospora corticicola]NYD36917.1 MFS family permease [Actinomycetospora corticicola]
MADAAAAQLNDPVARRRIKRRAVVASTVGTTIEWYDFFLYNTAAALVFGPLFFNNSSSGGVLLAFSTQFVGFAARPLGAAIFGHYGDRIGRKYSLVATLLIMGGATVLIGLLPTYDTIGVWAPVLLTVLRVLQGIGVGGEWGGSVLMAMEWGHRRQRGLMAAWPQAGVPIGLATGTFVVWAFAGPDFLNGGWRWPFIASIVLIAIGLVVRLTVLESPAFAAVRSSGKVVKLPLVETLKYQWRDVLKALFVRTAEQAPFYLFTSFVLVYGTQQLKLQRADLLLYLIVAALIGIVSVPFFGWLSDVLGRRLVYGAGVVLTGLYAFPYFALLDTRVGALVVLGMILGLVFHDMMYGPQAALISESFGTGVRYTGAGLGYQLASITAGGPAPLIATAVLAATGGTFWISIYIIGCAVVSLIALLLMHPKPPDEYDEHSEDGSTVPVVEGERAQA